MELEFLITEDLIIVLDLCTKIFDLGDNLVGLEVGQLAEFHFHDSICLLFGERETLTQSVFCLGDVLCPLDDRDNLVDVLDRNEQSAEYLLSLLCRIEIIAGATLDQGALIVEIVAQYLFEPH